MTREKKLLLLVTFNLTLMAVEVAGGLLSRSLALLSDAGHMLTDALAILLSYLALRWSRKPATGQRTYGYHRIEILVALFNGLTLLGVSGYIFYEALNRFFHPEPIKTGILLAVALLGLAGNLAGMLLLSRESHGNLNIRGAFMHLLSDTLSSVGVILGGLIIMFTGWNIVDSLIGILIGGLVLRGAFDLIGASSEILLEATPRDINVEVVREAVEAVEGVKGLHEIHIWTITSGRRALSGHITTDNISIRESQQILCAVRQMLNERFNITHTTLETECDACAHNACEYLHYREATTDNHHHHRHHH